MEVKSVLSVCALCVAVIVGLNEVGYYLTHPYRPGVSPFLIGLSIAVALIAIAQLISFSKQAK